MRLRVSIVQHKGTSSRAQFARGVPVRTRIRTRVVLEFTALVLILGRRRAFDFYMINYKLVYSAQVHVYTARVRVPEPTASRHRRPKKLIAIFRCGLQGGENQGGRGKRKAISAQCVRTRVLHTCSTRVQCWLGPRGRNCAIAQNGDHNGFTASENDTTEKVGTVKMTVGVG